MLARGVSEVLERSEPREVWGDTLGEIADADLRLANLECAVSDSGEPFRPPRVFTFRAIPKAMESLAAAGIEVVTLANNHSLDYEAGALLDTLARLDAAGIAHVGAGQSPEAAREPVVLEAAGKRVAIVGFTDNFPEYAATEQRPGTFYLPIEPAGVDEVASVIGETRGRGADFVVVTAHWGPNMRERPPEHFRDFARSIIEAGADLWFGHSAHIFQGVEFHRGRPIIYDGGDFIDDYAVDPHLRNDLSLLWKVPLGERVVQAHPVKLSYARTDLAADDDFDWIADRLAMLSAEMGSRLTRDDGRLVLEPGR